THRAAPGATAAASAIPPARPQRRAIAATTIGVTNCTPRAALKIEPTAVVRIAVGNSSANIGPKFDHVPVPNPVSQRQKRRSGGQISIQRQRSVIDTSPTAISDAYRLNDGFRPSLSDPTQNDET